MLVLAAVLVLLVLPVLAAEVGVGVPVAVLPMAWARRSGLAASGATKVQGKLGMSLKHLFGTTEAQ